ncbi:hypothetical protein SAMD00019534_087390 [Acytostelium subglobosum LB1]|uniref:hypothetical protein n=1 Tax=Acytostelium subglobosum LB1 TaxID=1410327 RepID=UPI000644B069|nr:hypothetical protein SAMD00019534_087390 [Acytostelium subglobosum LB1]GAM25564.1 hypothetical protein SAMD00019534_087390 [Acytostelium subglobosum LB1]|eukprot:XP_012751550.1 hypothetical protein SAMD00019534_087390 [Acytostelium subglobosum LB1]
MMKQRKETLESTDLSEIPKSDFVYDKKIPRLQLLIGEKNTNVIKESVRSMWHKRQTSNKTSDSKAVSTSSKVEPQKEKDGENKQFRQTEYEDKVIDTIKERNLGRLRIKTPKQGKTKLDVVRDKAKPLIPTYFHSKFKFVAAAKKSGSFIPETLPEVAFIGRSNVGKSSIINAVTQRGLAKTSDKPGYTQSINWYELGSTLYLVDLPGYGFAFAKSDRVDTWNQLTVDYLTTRKTLKRVFVLVDSRHGLKDSDKDLLKILDKSQVRTHVILTKGDLVPQEDLAKRFTLVTDELRQQYHYTEFPILIVSSKTYGGIPELASIMKGFKLRKKPEKPKPISSTTTSTTTSTSSTTTRKTIKPRVKELVRAKKPIKVSPSLNKYLKK